MSDWHGSQLKCNIPIVSIKYNVYTTIQNPNRIKGREKNALLSLRFEFYIHIALIIHIYWMLRNQYFLSTLVRYFFLLILCNKPVFFLRDCRNFNPKDPKARQAFTGIKYMIMGYCTYIFKHFNNQHVKHYKLWTCTNRVLHYKIRLTYQTVP